MWSLTEKVGIDEDRETEGTRAYVTHGERQVAGKLLLDAQLGFVGEWSHEVGIKAVEALCAGELRTANRGSSSTGWGEGARKRWPRGDEGYVGELEFAG